MSTETKTVKEVVVQTTTKVIAAIVAQAAAVAAAVSKKRQTGDAVRAEADRLGYDKKQATQMVALCWLEAFNMQKASDAEKAAFSLKSRPDVSKVIALAYPDKPAEYAKACKHNDSLPATAAKQNRIGENNLLKIARGETTVAEVLKTKADNKVKKPKSGLDAIMTPTERLQNAFAGVLTAHHIGEKGKPTLDECNSAYEAARDAFTKAKK